MCECVQVCLYILLSGGEVNLGVRNEWKGSSFTGTGVMRGDVLSFTISPSPSLSLSLTLSS